MFEAPETTVFQERQNKAQLQYSQVAEDKTAKHKILISKLTTIVLDTGLLKAPQVHYITLAPVWVLIRINFDPMEHVQYGGCSKHEVGGAGSVVNMLQI